MLSRNKITNIFKIIDFASIASILLLFISGLVLILTKQRSQWVDLLFDDAYYYLGLARNMAEHGSSSFLPPYQTNGYQPLWLLLLSLSAFVFGTAENALVLQLFTLMFIFVGVFSYASKVAYGYAFPAIAACASFPLITLSGMETAMAPLFVVGIFSAKKWASKGVFSSLLFLTRLDALAFILVNDIYKFVVKKERCFKHYIILLPIVLCYFLLNNTVFGIAVPVSGLSKSVGNKVGENISVYYNYLFSLKSAFCLIFVLYLLNFFRSGNVKVKYVDEISVALLSVIPIATYYALKSGWPLWEWYFWPSLIAYFYATLSVVNYIKDSSVNKALNRIDFVSIFLISMIFIYTVKPAASFAGSSFLKHKATNPGSFGVKNVELVEYLKQNGFKTGTYFAMGDRAGSFGFFLGNDYKFFHTEGLVGPYAYYLQMKNDNGAEFLRKTGAKYLIADREKFMQSGETMGVIEPVQGLSSKFGPYMLCFNKDAVILNQSYSGWANNERYLFDMQKEVPCPESILNEFKDLRSTYGELRKATFPSDYPKDRGVVDAFINKIIPLPPGY